MSQSHGTRVITLSQPTGGTVEALASDDPTNSAEKRQQFRGRFQSRWESVEERVRMLIQGDRHYKPGASRRMDADSAQIADFREWLESTLDEVLIEPAPQRAIRRGRHWTAPFTKNLYVHGIRQADAALRRVGWDFTAPDPETAIHYEPHEDRLAQQFVETYQDVVDAARAAERDATRAYRSAVNTTASVSETIGDVNDRLEKVGRNRTDLVAETKSIRTINEAVLTRYEQVGANEVGVEIETIPEGEDSLSHTCTHATVEALDEHDNDIPQFFDTAGDDRVCPECSLLAGNVYTIKEIRDGSAPEIPRHPRCRCVYTILNPADASWR